MTCQTALIPIQVPAKATAGKSWGWSSVGTAALSKSSRAVAVLCLELSVLGALKDTLRA